MGCDGRDLFLVSVVDWFSNDVIINWANRTAESRCYKNYRLAFINYSKFWHGPPVTKVPTANAHIWGVIWKISSDEVMTLDDQGEPSRYGSRRYFPLLSVEILSPHMGSFICRTYEQRYNPLPRGDHDDVPLDQCPSKSYKRVMILGATEHGLPDYYIESLKKLQHNGEEGGLRLREMLRTYSQQAPCECLVPGRIPRTPLKLDLRKNRYVK